MTMQRHNAGKPATDTLVFCSGWGKSDTHAVTLNDGKPNPHKSAGTPYTGISGRDLVALVKAPQTRAKESAQWFIPSTYCQCDGRSHEAQRQNGAYWFLSIDIDRNNLDLADVLATVEAVTGDCGMMIYSTSSSTADNRKWRVLVPLQQPIAGADYGDTMRAFNNRLEDKSSGVLIPDRALERTGQVIYLPNKRGDFYQHQITKGARFDLTADHPIIKQREDTRAKVAEAAKEAHNAHMRRKAKPAAMPDSEAQTPVDHFNERNTVAEMLVEYGYTRAGQSDHYRSPYQTGKTYATRDYGDYWLSLSDSDAAAGIGATTRGGMQHGDAFDLYCHFQHRGDMGAAVKAYALEAGLSRPTQERASGGAGCGAGDDSGQPDALPDGLDLSQDALALDMGVTGWDRDALHVALWGKWLFWQPTHWGRDDNLSHMTKCRGYLRSRAADVTAWAEKKAFQLAQEGDDAKAEKLKGWAKAEAKTLRHKNTVAAVVDLARSNPASVANAKDFDADHLLLGTPGGTVDLRTGTMRPARRGDMITKQTTVAPEPGKPTLWLRFLSEIFDGDADLIAFMQRAAGYALTGETREHKLLFLYGTGRNGKSVFLNTLFDIWGDYSRRAAAETFLNSHGEKHSTGLAGLNGARLVAGSELPKGKTWDESVIKDLTGGDVMTARLMRGDFFDFDPQLTLMIAGNNMPSFKGVDEAIRARVVLVPFTVTIPAEKRDQHLAAKLKAEAGQILQWAIDGAVAWQARGLDVTASVAAASASYFDDEDILGQFLADETRAEPLGFVTTTELHQRFTQWCGQQGLNAWTMMTLQKEVKGRGYQNKRMTRGAGFIGIVLK